MILAKSDRMRASSCPALCSCTISGWQSQSLKYPRIFSFMLKSDSWPPLLRFVLLAKIISISSMSIVPEITLFAKSLIRVESCSNSGNSLPILAPSFFLLGVYQRRNRDNSGHLKKSVRGASEGGTRACMKEVCNRHVIFWSSHLRLDTRSHNSPVFPVAVTVTELCDYRE